MYAVNKKVIINITGSNEATSMLARLGDNSKAGFSNRTSSSQGRLIQKDGYWYYGTREGVDIGPFDTIGEAKQGLSEFVDFIVASEPSMAETLKQYRSA
jgi:hypothetical protein